MTSINLKADLIDSIFRSYPTMDDVPKEVVNKAIARNVLFPVVKNYIKAWKKECDGKRPQQCKFYAMKLLNSGNLTGAISLFKKACSAGDNFSCLRLYNLGTSNTSKKKLASAIRKNCKANSSECFAQEIILYKEKKTKEAISLAEKNCIKRLHPKSCQNLYGPLLSSLDLEKINPAKNLKERCEKEDWVSCFQQTLIDNSLKPADAVLLAERACRKGVLRACQVITGMVNKNKKFLDNEFVVKSLFLYCMLGNSEACAETVNVDPDKYKDDLKSFKYLECSLNPKKGCFENLLAFKSKKLVKLGPLEVPQEITQYISLDFKKCKNVTVDQIEFEKGFVKKGYKIVCRKEKSITESIVYENAQQVSITDYNLKSKKHGVFQRYNFAGELVSYTTYKNGEIDSDVINFSAPGILKEIKSYQNGKYVGYIDYYQNGVIKSYQSFNDKNDIDGLHYRFNESGEVIEKSLYKNGKLITPKLVLNYETLRFDPVQSFEIVKIKNKYQCIRRPFVINDYILSQKTMNFNVNMSFIDQLYYQGTNSLGMRVYFVEKEEQCSKAIKQIKASEE